MIVSLKDKAQWVSSEELQGNDEKDWGKAKLTVSFDLPRIKIHKDTTKNQLVTKYKLKSGMKLVLYNDDDNIKRGIINSVTIDNYNTTDEVDIFEDKSCILFYKFDNSSKDETGKHDGIWTGKEKYDDGKYGLGAYFNGKSYITAKDFAVQPCKSMTFSFWIKTSQKSRFSIMNQRTGSYSPSKCNLMITFNGGNKVGDIWFNFPGYNDGTQLTTNHNIMDNKFHHCVFMKSTTCKKSILSVYIDGKKIAEKSGKDVTFEQNGAFLIGTENDKSCYFNGVLDHVRIFNRALTEDEIDILYNEKYTRYIADISNFNLSKAPSDAWFDRYMLYRLSINDFMKPMDILTLDDTTTNTEIHTKNTIKEYDSLIIYNEIDGYKEFFVENVKVNNGVYKVDISNLNLSDVPSIVYRKQIYNITNQPDELNIQDATINKITVKSDKEILEGQEAVLYNDTDGYKHSTLGSVTKTDDGVYEIDISNFELTKEPTNGWLGNPLRFLRLINKEKRYIDEKNTLVINGEKIKPIFVSTDNYDDENYIHLIEIPQQKDIPTTFSVIDTSSIQEEYDDEQFDGSLFERTYKEYKKRGRRLKYGIIADKNVKINQVKVDLWKQA